MSSLSIDFIPSKMVTNITGRVTTKIKKIGVRSSEIPNQITAKASQIIGGVD